MIQDSNVLKEIQESWHGVCQLKAKVSGAIAGSIAAGGLFAIFIADAAHNLTFLHACSVLNATLEQLRDEGHFKCGSFFLGSLVKESAKHLPWVDYALIMELVDKRNDVAHHGKILKTSRLLALYRCYRKGVAGMEGADAVTRKGNGRF